MPKIDFRDDKSLYVIEKLSEAVHALATGAGRVQERLGEATTYLTRINAENLPDEELRRMLVGIVDDLTFEQAKRDQGRLGATVPILHDEVASSIACRILELYRRLDDALGRGTP
jgi:hypothetical protein